MGGDTGILIMCERPYSPMQYGSPKSSRVAVWLDEQAWQLFGDPRRVSKTLGVISGDSRLGRAAMAFSSATPDRLHTTPDRPCACAGESGSSPDPDTRTFVWRKSQKVSATTPCVCVWGTAEHGDHLDQLTKGPHSLRRLIHGARRRAQR
jgi:hypothetical protein